MDLSKRTFKACVLTRGKDFEDRKIFSGGMTPEGRGHLLSRIGKKDVVAIEGGTSSNNFARELESVAGMVFFLNPGKLHIIFHCMLNYEAEKRYVWLYPYLHKKLESATIPCYNYSISV